MLRRIAIENFKGVGERVELELAPVTLLFGPNSAGKSTVLQALQYMHHLLARGNPSADRMPHGGDSVDLGGFDSFVHQHDNELTVSIRVAFDVTSSINVFGQDDLDFAFPDLDDEVDSAWVEMRVRAELVRDGIDATVTEMLIGAGDEPNPLARTTRELRDGAEELVAWVNLEHPSLHTSALDEAAFEVFGEGRNNSRADDGLVWWRLPIPAAKRSAMPLLDRPLGMYQDDGTDETDDASGSTSRRQLQTLLTMLLVGVPVVLSRELEGLTYVGPLRIVPGRGFVPERSPRPGRWADGSGAWDMLALGGAAMRTRVNDALERVGVPYRVGQQLGVGGVRLDEPAPQPVGAGFLRSAVLVDRDGITLLPSDLGVGVSQLIPVVAACLRHGSSLVAIEQPEFHIHPAWQTQLGDLFIDTAAKRQLIVETHSEHIILRLIRRIRETTEGALPDGAPTFSPDKLSVLHVDRVDGKVRIQRLRLDASGEFSDKWPHGFFEERAEELF